MVGSRSSSDNQSAFMKTVGGLSNILAFIAAFLGTPLFYGETADTVGQLSADSYGYSFYDISVIGWGIASFILIFLVTRIALQSLVMLIAVSTAKRFL